MKKWRLWLLAQLDAKASWIQLANVRDSFLSKATTAFSVATFGLSNLAKPLGAIGFDLRNIRLLFVGSMLFLVGYLIVAVRLPLEFRGSRSLDEIVERMFRVHTYVFFNSRLKMTASLLKCFEGKDDIPWLRGPIEYTRSQIAAGANANNNNWHNSARGLYHSDVVLRQYNRPAARITALLFLAVGLLMMLVPTLFSVFRAMVGLVS